ncbi:MAG TPA: PhzF family phenazine biosynthesis protein [Ktedonobacterales bacterium]
MTQRITQVDAFTAEPFAGNPAGVCLLPDAGDPAWMQRVACEMNLAETAFLHKQGDDYSLRWFTPTTEVDLCGHATLASAHVFWEEGHLPSDQPARFHTRSGLLTATRDGAWINMDFPATPPQATEPPDGLLAALGVASAVWTGKTRWVEFVELESGAAVRALVPDMGRLARFPMRGVIVTARAATPEYDFVSRFFAPAAGVPEDPVTGSAHSALAPYWAERLNKSAMTGYQVSPRGGVILVRPSGDRVIISGQAVTTLRGELLA